MEEDGGKAGGRFLRAAAFSCLSRDRRCANPLRKHHHPRLHRPFRRSLHREGGALEPDPGEHQGSFRSGAGSTAGRHHPGRRPGGFRTHTEQQGELRGQLPTEGSPCRWVIPERERPADASLLQLGRPYPVADRCDRGAGDRAGRSRRLRRSRAEGDAACRKRG